MMTAEQAAERGKTLSFEKVWAMFEETDRKFAETDKKILELSKNLSGIGFSLGNWSEEMFASNLCEKVNPLGYEFEKVGRDVKFKEPVVAVSQAIDEAGSGGVSPPLPLGSGHPVKINASTRAVWPRAIGKLAGAR